MTSKTITLTRIRELDLTVAPGRGRPRHLSAASGLVRAGSFLYVVADDELHLGVFSATSSRPGALIRLFKGKLPPAKKARKARKPDLEALVLLPAFAKYPHGALLALGSGSKKKRRRGALLALDALGAVTRTPKVIDLSPMFGALEDEFDALNIEGAFVSGNELRLLQRGNQRGANAVLRFHLPAVLDSLQDGSRIGAIAPFSTQRFDLGSIGGIALCFTDGAALPDGAMVFTAVAENTDDSYSDGACAGAAIGIADRKGRLRSLLRLRRPHKIEGVNASVDNGVVRLLLVTDADDADVPAGVYAVTIDAKVLC